MRCDVMMMIMMALPASVYAHMFRSSPDYSGMTSPSLSETVSVPGSQSISSHLNGVMQGGWGYGTKNVQIKMNLSFTSECLTCLVLRYANLNRKLRVEEDYWNVHTYSNTCLIYNQRWKFSTVNLPVGKDALNLRVLKCTITCG
jgi:hypothetical protein